MKAATCASVVVAEGDGGEVWRREDLDGGLVHLTGGGRTLSGKVIKLSVRQEESSLRGEI
jgi:hypothetical protein